MSVTDEQTKIRSMTLMGNFHRLIFTSIAILAIISHVKAMTTDPGAVPPDAKPLDLQEETEIKSLLDPPARVKRLCRRCKTYKPDRAHHCSVCNRCIIKME
jgi:palmitoyltransferase